MADFIEIKIGTTIGNYAVNPASNRATSIELNETDSFSNSGTAIFKDSNGVLQELTFTNNNTGSGVLTVVGSSWRGSGTLESLASVYQDYLPTSNSSFGAMTERVIVD
tara:strand:+ start:712 stop:1035 length:324 start_codon:yes stop_codon:yes gene_type:complete